MADGICPFADWRPGVTTFGAGGPAKVGFCDHTAGGFYSTLKDPGFWNGHGYSVHFGISLKGEACQLVNIFDRAWGQGRLGPTVGWGRYAFMGRRNPNEYLISTEHEDTILENGRTRFLPPVWSPEMYAMDLRIKRWCIDEYKRVKGVDIMPFGVDSLCGHHMFDGVNRVNCPGPYWKNEYRERLYRDLTQGDEAVMNRFNSFSPWYDNPANQDFNGKRGVNARMDFVGLPLDAVAIEADISLKEGSGPLVIYDHDEETQNASYAFSVPQTIRYMHGRVNLDPDNGWFHMVGENAKIARIAIVGYYIK